MATAAWLKLERFVLDAGKKVKIRRIEAGGSEQLEDVVAVEAPLTIRVNGAQLVSLLYTPGMDEELALGYLLSEGIIGSMEDVSGLSVEKGEADVKLAAPLPVTDAPAVRVLTSGCGGGITFTYPQGLKSVKRLSGGLVVEHDKIVRLVSGMRGRSGLFEQTGGVHSAALSDGEEVLAFADDIGRHNAVDKVFGYCLKSGINTADTILFTTGRVSSEVLIKCVKRKVPVVVSRGAPTSLAVELAERLGVTLVGFARGRRMNVYAHPERVRV